MDFTQPLLNKQHVQQFFSFPQDLEREFLLFVENNEVDFDVQFILKKKLLNTFKIQRKFQSRQVVWIEVRFF